MVWARHQCEGGAALSVSVALSIEGCLKAFAIGFGSYGLKFGLVPVLLECCLDPVDDRGLSTALRARSTRGLEQRGVSQVRGADVGRVVSGLRWKSQALACRRVWAVSYETLTFAPSPASSSSARFSVEPAVHARDDAHLDRPAAGTPELAADQTDTGEADEGTEEVDAVGAPDLQGELMPICRSR